MMPLESKLTPPQGSQAGIQEKRISNSKFLSPETGRRRAFIYAIYHHLLDLYQFCSYNVPWVKTGPAPEDRKFENKNKEDQLQNSFCLKLEQVEL